MLCPTTTAGFAPTISLARISEEQAVITVVSIMAGVLLFWVVMRSIALIVRHVQVERSRREIAAYIAEGSMTPEQGAELLRARPGKRGNT